MIAPRLAPNLLRTFAKATAATARHSSFSNGNGDAASLHLSNAVIQLPANISSSKVGTGDNEMVFRSYDSRFRKLDLSSGVCQKEECKDIVGTVDTAVELKYESVPFADEKCKYKDQFLIGLEEQSLLIIAARHGDHVAKTPKYFLPIIDQLVLLHSNNLVHGDIRAFNTAFGEKEKEGRLIDSDFGGKMSREHGVAFRR